MMLIHVYHYSSDNKEIPDALEKEELLIPPVVVNHQLWTMEYFETNRRWTEKHCSYSTEAFVDWLNQFITKEEKTTIMAVSSRQIDDTLPIIYF